MLVRNHRVVGQTEDHKPAAERERIRQVGHGHSVSQGRLWSALMPGNEKFGLSTSRSLGDFILKTDSKGLVHTPHGSLSADPIVSHYRIDQPTWLVMASDGLWDALSSEELAKHLSTWLKSSYACQDNISVLLLKLE